MKLSDLSRKRILQRAAQSNLVVNTTGITYIISDVPRLTRSEFEQLRDVSFEDFQRHMMFVLPDSVKGELAWKDSVWANWEQAYGDNLIETMKWKEYVAKHRAKIPQDPELGDFA